jgi:hypothetical protein
LPKRLASGSVFQKAATARPELVIGAGNRGFGDGAKRNRVQVIENKQFRAMSHFAPPMISMAYARVAKPFVSLGEMNPSASAGFPPHRGPKRDGREIDGGLRARATDVARLCDSERRRTIAKWRRKPLESLKMDSEMASGRLAVAPKENRSSEFRIKLTDAPFGLMLSSQRGSTREERS